ncbi:hypothetical protein FGO68_gene9302 [Halteria grandinella]|uniref:RING-type domain-containing protein n=1 Tax=Halteria grandinella TaxID=5974 RepID=A0A8J8NT13_HALGN|nr:hypothetical protein FGO68_gene9302 [Halteria grandinella]
MNCIASVEWEPVSKQAVLSISGGLEDNEEFQATICSICLSDVQDGEVLACKHEFCKGCIKMWKARKASCPVCRSGDE